MRDRFGRFKKGFKHSPEALRKIKDALKKRPSNKAKIKCEVCGNIFETFPYRKSKARFCSRKCNKIGVGKYISRGKETNCPILSSQGYWFLHIKDHPRANTMGYVKMCDFIFEKYHRPIKSNEIIHHKDGCKTNDHPDNLEAFDKIKHDRMHTIKRHASGNFRSQAQ